MATPITKEQRIEEVETLIAKAEEWASFYEHPIHDKPHREMFEGMAKVMAEYLAALRDAEPVYQCEFCHHDAHGELQWHWEDVNKDFYDQYDPERRGKRRVLYGIQPIPKDWVMVPVEPTLEMIKYGAIAASTGMLIPGVYRAMLAAAPQQEG